MTSRALTLAFALFAAGCCTRLPRLPAKSVAFPAIAPRYERIDESAETWHDAHRNRDVPVRIYAPADAHARLPVVIFSHGIGENRDSYVYLGRALAQHGYLAVHVTHAGTDRAVLERGYRHLYRAVKQKVNWVNRPLDVSFVLDQLTTRVDADMTRVAVVGHSAGAFTAFAVAGLRTTGGETFRDDRVKVAIPISMPRMDGVVTRGGYDAIGIPLLNLTGTCDTSLIYRTFPRHRRIPFDSTHARRQYLVTIEGANHDSFVVDDPRHPQIVAIVVAFLRAWLEDDAASRAWFDDAGIAKIGGVRICAERKGTDAAK
jgi:hypothetical protein